MYVCSIYCCTELLLRQLLTVAIVALIVAVTDSYYCDGYCGSYRQLLLWRLLWPLQTVTIVTVIVAVTGSYYCDGYCSRYWQSLLWRLLWQLLAATTVTVYIARMQMDNIRHTPVCHVRQCPLSTYLESCTLTDRFLSCIAPWPNLEPLAICLGPQDQALLRGIQLHCIILSGVCDVFCVRFT